MVGKLVRIFDILSTIQRSPIFRQTQIHPHKQLAHTSRTYQLTEPFRRQLTEKEKRNRHKREQRASSWNRFIRSVCHTLSSPIPIAVDCVESAGFEMSSQVFVDRFHTRFIGKSFHFFLLQYKWCENSTPPPLNSSTKKINQQQLCQQMTSEIQSLHEFRQLCNNLFLV